MAVDAIIAAVVDAGAGEVAAATLADAVTTAAVDVAVTDAAATAVEGAIAAGADAATTAAVADTAATAATDAVAAGASTDAATAAGVDAASGAVAPSSGIASVEVTPAGDVVNGVQTGANATGAGGAGPVATDASGATTQVFDDGSTLTTHADGTVTATHATDTGALVDANGNKLVSPGGPGQAPVYDAAPGTPGTNNPLGNGTPTLTQGLTDYAKAVGDSLGTAGLLGAGALGGAALTGALAPKSNLTGQVGSGNVKYEWGTAPELVNPGLNPGYIGHAASMPYYHSNNPTDAQYYWGVHAPVTNAADLAHYNEQAGAPATPWGAGHGGGGATPGFNPADFVNQYILNPAYAGINTATSPGYTGPAVPAQQ
jgi:hypothetical protein